MIHPHLTLGGVRTLEHFCRDIYNCLTHLVQHHIADGWQSLRLLYAGGHELKPQQEVPVILTLPIGVSQVWTTKQGLRGKEREKRANI